MHSPTPAPPKLIEAIAQFNRGEFFACHETLEELWMPASGSVKEFYQGLIQVAAGLHHLQRGNLAGAVALVRRGRTRLEAFNRSPGGPSHGGLDVPALVASVDACLGPLEAAAVEGIKGFDRALIPKVSLKRFGAERRLPSSSEATEPD
ncbi:MAG: DUF309 domain-containing protein [Dehalococcoidia bacterium]|nr:DUF309 domain-containing protein [Dehalococcoidia bacterium]